MLLGDMLALVVKIVHGLLVQVLSEMAEVVVCGGLVGRDGLDLGVDGLVQVAVLKRLLLVDQLLCSRRHRVQGVVVLLLLLVGLGRGRILSHLR